MPDNASVINVEFFTQAIDTKKAEVRYVVDVGHDEKPRNVAQFFTVFGMNAVGIEIIEECFDNGIGLGDVHFLGVEFGHLSGIEACKMGPAGLEYEFVNIY